MWFSREGWNGVLLFNVYRVSVWEEENVLELDRDDGYKQYKFT